MGPHTKSPTGKPHTVVDITLDEGDWLDVMDYEGTWNVAQIIRFVDERNVEVRYDGWGNEYNEVVPLNSDRVAPYHTYTWSVKCWAKYKNWPWWPSIVTIRSPGTLAGQEYLMTENRLFVDFLDGKDFSKRCRCWVELSKMTPFEEKYDERRKRTSGTDFEASLAMSLTSMASSKFPAFASGTLPIQYMHRIADPVKLMKKSLGAQAWAGSFSTSCARHRAVYRYKPTNGGGRVMDDEDDDEDDDYLVQFAAVSDKEDDAPKKSRTKGKGKAKGKSGRRAIGGKDPSPRHQRGTSALQTHSQDSLGTPGAPHTSNPEKGGEDGEQPLFLPPIEDVGENSAAPATGVGVEHVHEHEPRTAELPLPAPEPPRKRKSQEDSSAEAKGVTDRAVRQRESESQSG